MQKQLQDVSGAALRTRKRRVSAAFEQTCAVKGTPTLANTGKYCCVWSQELKCTRKNRLHAALALYVGTENAVGDMGTELSKKNSTQPIKLSIIS
jgi:hypothetical protein